MLGERLGGGVKGLGWGEEGSVGGEGSWLSKGGAGGKSRAKGLSWALAGRGALGRQRRPRWRGQGRRLQWGSGVTRCPSGAAAPNPDHVPAEERQGTDPNGAALLGRWAGIPMAHGGSAARAQGLPSTAGAGARWVGAKRLSLLLLLLGGGVEVRGFCPRVLNAARAGGGSELRCVVIITAATVLLFFGFGV